jgi:HK97 family phage major capsid protein
LVQEDFINAILKRTYELSVLGSRVWKIPVSGNANGVVITAIDETSRAHGSRWGGVLGYWAAEAAEKTESQPKFRAMDLKLKKLIGLCYSSDEALQDASALETIIIRAFTEEFAFQIDDAIYRGTGAGMPLGILNSPCLVTVNEEVGQPAGTFLFENAVNMWSRMWGRSRPNAVWLINQDVEPQLFGMSLAVGAGGIPVYLPANGLSGSPYGSLFGRPVIPIEHAATLGTVGDIMLADMSQYVTIDKGGIQAASSIHVKFVYDKTAFRFVYRIDGQPLWNAPLIPFQGAGNTQGPFVVLETR